MRRAGSNVRDAQAAAMKGTPDRLAAEGTGFTNFYSAHPSAARPGHFITSVKRFNGSWLVISGTLLMASLPPLPAVPARRKKDFCLAL